MGQYERRGDIRWVAIEALKIKGCDCILGIKNVAQQKEGNFRG